MSRPSTRLIPALEAVGDLIAHICLITAALALFAIVAINGANVACRYFAGFAFSWGEEAMLFLMILMIFAGTVAAAWRGAHMHLDMLVQRLPVAWQRACVIFTALAAIVLLVALSSGSYQVVSALYRFGQTSVALDFPMWIPQGCVTAGFLMIAAMIGLRLIVFGVRLPKSEMAELIEHSS